jgi:hypothetical protein
MPRPPVQRQQFEKPVSPVAKAADDVRQIVESLEHTLEHMEEVLRLVELAEDQKLGDEREIESLRRALRRVQVPRGEPMRERRPEPRRDQPPRREYGSENRAIEPEQREELPPPEESDLRPPERFSSEESEEPGSEEQGS